MSKIQSIQPNYQSNLQRISPKQNKQIVFGQEPTQKQEKEPEEKKGGISVKTATNVLGVLAWLGVVGYSIAKLKLYNPKSPEMVAEAAKKLDKKVLSLIENAESNGVDNVNDAFKNSKFKGVRKAFSSMGDWFQNAKMRVGSELFNNLLYAFGTLVVMPLVVIYSPFGKKNSTKEDKQFAVLRQPLSVAATLSMQFTFDKLIDKFVPEVMKQNKFEDKLILGSDGKIQYKDANGKFMHENFNGVKYNFDSIKEGFKELLKVKQEDGGLKGLLTEDEVKELFEKRSFDEESSSVLKDKLKEIFNERHKELDLESLDDAIENKLNFQKFKNKNHKAAEAIEKVLEKFKQVINVLDNNKIAVQKYKTGVNVIAASIIGCTFLNVIYGKTMKSMKKHKDETLATQSQNAKEVK